MHHALSLARRGLGNVWPNPAVGAVVVQNGQVIAQGWTQPGGRPHAEAMALQAAGLHAKGASLYVTLEPCAHTGKTPPCTQAIIDAGIKQVVVACRDPNPRVNGQGIAQLREAGINIIENVCKREAEDVNAGFFSVINHARPWVMLKVATSADEKIACPQSTEKWITNDRSRACVHALRASYDAVLTGIGTVLADDPLLTCRLPGLTHRSPVRIVLDTHLRIPLTSQLVQTARTTPLWVIGGQDAPEEKQQQLQAHGVQVILIPTDPRTNSLSLTEITKALVKERSDRGGLTRLMIEGGASMNTSWLESGLVDELYWFKAPAILDGSAATALHNATLNNTIASHWSVTHRHALAQDTLLIATKKRP